MEHQVDTLRLTVRGPAGHAAPAARLAEQFARNVLDRFVDIVEERLPGRVVLIRHLAAHWNVSETAMADPAETVTRAAELADAVTTRSGPAADGGIVIFDDEGDWLAAYLRDRAGGNAERWYHARWREAEDVGAADGALLDRAVVLTALARLLAAGDFPGILAQLPPSTLSALATTPGLLAANVGTPPGVVAAFARAAVPSPDGSARPGAAVGSASSLSSDRRLAQGEEDAASGLTPVNGSSHPASGRDAAFSQSASNGAPADVERAVTQAVAAAAQRVGISTHPPPGSADQATPGNGIAATRFGGLFYLLGLASELAIGEALWKVCLREGLVLAQAAAVLLGSIAMPGTIDDPAPALFGGVGGGELCEWPAISPEQQGAVATELLAATAAALPRYGAAPQPESVLDLMPAAGGRMLIAFGSGSFPLFVWPAPDALAAAAGLEAFLGVWPSSFPPPRASEVLRSLDPGNRLQQQFGATPRLATALAVASGPTTALLAQIGGALATLFMARAMAAEATGSLLDHLVLPGRVVVRGPETMMIVLPMRAINVAIRRAGLDRDPGWVPWLGRTVRFEFAAESEGEVV